MFVCVRDYIILTQIATARFDVNAQGEEKAHLGLCVPLKRRSAFGVATHRSLFQFTCAAFGHLKP